MKRLIYFIVLLNASILLANSQVPNFPKSETGEILFTEVVKIDSTSKSELFLKAKEFLTKSFVSYKNIVQIDDESNGIILIKPIFDVYSYITSKTKIGHIKYTFKIQFKDGRYKYEMTDFFHVEPKLKTPGNLLAAPPTEDEDFILHYTWNSVQKQAYKYALGFIEEFQSHMKSKVVDENW